MADPRLKWYHIPAVVAKAVYYMAKAIITGKNT